MIEAALKARIPLIAANTTDTTHARSVISHAGGFAKGQPGAKIWALEAIPGKIQKGEIYVRIGDLPKGVMEDHGVELQGRFTTAEAVLVVVNATKTPDTFFDVGELPVPDPLIIKLLGTLGAEDKFDDLAPAIGGLTIKEVEWCIRLSTTNGGGLTKEGLSKARKLHLPARPGLGQVTSEIGPYVPFSGLADWLEEEGDFFLADVDPRLVPRGILFDGPPGTGKTMGAKWLAKEFGVPLYRIAAEDVKNKYVGESEKALAAAFAAVDRDAPAVLLIDEVEKMFGSSGDQGTTVSMLATLLWWLAEHESRVLTVMTCNAKSAIPPEVIRPGRIDAQLYFEGLTANEAKPFADFIGASYTPKPKPELLKQKVLHLYGAPTDTTEQNLRIPQAQITEAVKSAVKATISEGE